MVYAEYATAAFLYLKVAIAMAKAEFHSSVLFDKVVLMARRWSAAEQPPSLLRRTTLCRSLSGALS